MKKEFLKENESLSNGQLHLTENYTILPPAETAESVKVKKFLKESKQKNSPMSLRPRIEAIHAGRTRNDNIYPAEKLKGDLSAQPNPTGVYSFLYPYPKPIIKNHDDTTEPTGRVLNAQFIKDSQGKECIVLIPNITDPDAIEKVLDGRYLTVSIGASTDSAICNICGKDVINEGWCGHERGVEYDGVKCGWIVGNLWFNECSWVNIPADPNAKVVDTGDPQTMEAYMEVNNEFYDISGNQGLVAVQESVASTLGLVASKQNIEGGQSTVSENSKTLSLEEFTALEEKANLVESLNATIAEKDATIAEKEASLVEKETALAEKDTTIAEKDTLIGEKDATITTLTGDKESLNTKNATLEAEKQALVDQNTELSANWHKDLVEKVVDLKIALNKPGVDDRDEAIASHSTRNMESLNDTYEDLMIEVGKGKTIYVPASVTNPGLGALPGEPNSTIEGLDGDVKKDLNNVDVIANLLAGSYKRKNIKGGNK